MTTASESKPARKPVVHHPRPLRLKIHSVLRWIHIYISMFSMLVVLFFAVTGITLNHPEWLSEGAGAQKELKGTLPAGWKNGANIDWLKIAEYLRQKEGVHGNVADYRADETEGSITFKAPGYSADCFFDPNTGTYQLTVASQGFLGVMNDFHRGRDAGTVWARIIDICGVFLTVVALTGLGLLWYLKKLRLKALLTFAAGCVLVVVLMKMAA